MPSKDEKQVLIDILDNIILGTSFVKNLTYKEFLNKKCTVYATVRALEIISEATRPLSDGLCNRYPDIPWKNIKGAGNVYRHDYEDVLESMVQATIHHAFPLLENVVREELERYK